MRRPVPRASSRRKPESSDFGPLRTRRRIPAYAGMTPGKKVGGFTLVELVAAFAIFAIGVSIALSIGANALGMAKRSSEYTRAALHAQSILDVVGVGEPLSEGSDAGEFDDGYRWELAVTQQEPPAAATGAIEELPIELYRLELVVRWGDEREAKFTTLRATSPSLGGASAPSPGGQR